MSASSTVAEARHIEGLIAATIQRTPATRHRLGLDDHEPEPRALCGECRSLAAMTLAEVLDEHERRTRRPWSLLDLDMATIGTTYLRHRQEDAVRKQRVRDGFPAKASQVAGAEAAQSALAAAWERGELPVPVATATAVLARGVQFLTTPGDRADLTGELPWERMGRALGPDRIDLAPGEVSAVWQAAIAALLATPEGTRHLDRNVFPHLGRVSVGGLEVGGGWPRAADDPEMAWLQAAEEEAAMKVAEGRGSADEVLAAIVDRDVGGGDTAAHVRGAAPDAWAEAIGRVERAARTLARRRRQG